MIRNSVHTFDDKNSIGVNKVPIKGLIHIEDFNGSPKLIQKISGGVDKIDDFINASPLKWGEVSSSLGVAWVSGFGYRVGDVSTELEKTYLCIGDHTSGVFNTGVGSPTQLNQDRWISISTGAHQSHLAYKEGDIVSYLDKIYVAPVGGVSSGDPAPDQPSTPWITGIINEKGGISWKVGIDYEFGDSVYDETVPPGAIYVCITDHKSANGDVNNGSPQQPASMNWTAEITEDPGIF